MNLKRILRPMPICLTSALLLAGCNRHETNTAHSSQRPTAQAPAAMHFPEGIAAPVRSDAARDPMISMQPLKPGLSWTYDVKVTGHPWVFRRLSYDLMHGNECMESEHTGPMNEWEGIGTRVRYTVTDRTKEVDGENGPTTFYRIRTETLNDGTWSYVNNGLYWGRVRMDLMSFAICEIRDLAPATLKIQPVLTDLLLDSISNMFKNVEGHGPAFHTRFLCGDICVHQDLPDLIKEDQFSLGPLHMRIRDKWDCETKTDWLDTTVPAGAFKTLRSTFTYSGGGEMDTTDEMLYSMNVGLVKWSQTSGGTLRWTAELSSYDKPK